MRTAFVLASAALLSCSGSNGDAGSSGTGGMGGMSSGGAVAAAGTSSGAMGGVVNPPASGGSGAVAATGGVSSTSGTGGSTATGGGGATSSAGTTSAGGTTSSGGATNSGGTTNSGGATGPGGTNSGGSAGSGGAAPSCGIPTLDPSKPPATLTLTGDLGTHDPSLILANGVYYLFATGNGIATKTSTTLLDWKGTPDVFSSIPSWVAGKISGVTNVWAPDISFFGRKYHLYYAVSSFGSNKSCIGHATRDSLSAGAWADHGSVICSNVGTTDDWNAIDPNVIVDDTGTPWLDFGSFWSGIKLIQLDADGNRVGTQVRGIASHSSIEGPFIVHQCGYYYLFVSFGACCGNPYDYNVRVGRSKTVTGPYVDKAGTDMMNSGGTQVVQGNSTWTAPGHNAVLVTSKGAYNVYHALNASHANPTLRISELVLDAQGWPVSAGP